MASIETTPLLQEAPAPAPEFSHTVLLTASASNQVFPPAWFRTHRGAVRNGSLRMVGQLRGGDRK